MEEFSGGEQTKIALIGLLLDEPDIILFDEPTNQLDMLTVEWLEKYLRDYPKAVVMVSHDRFFLDRTAEIVYEFCNQRLIRYVGNYTEFRRQKMQNLRIARKQYERQQEEIERLNGLIERFKHKPNKAAFARSRKKILERMVKIEKPVEDGAHIFTGDLLPKTLGDKWVLETEDLKIGYKEALLDMTLRVKRGQKIAIIGENGTGKSTFLKSVVGKIPPVDGKVRMGKGIVYGYFDQLSTEALVKKSSENTTKMQVLQYFEMCFPTMQRKEVRQYLANYLFRGSDVYKFLEQLSGGERARFILAELLCEAPNCLILDEPTNHMDIPAKETLESAFQSYKGTMLFVSHDRYFVEQVADALLIFEKGHAFYYPFGYKHYVERRDAMARLGKTMNVSSAEDMALIAGLQNVPKKSTLLGHELSTEQAYWDWQLSLAFETMEKAAEAVHEKQDAEREIKEASYRKWVERESGLQVENLEYRETESVNGLGIRSGDNLDAESVNNLETSSGNSSEWEAWHEACMAWYDVWSELYPEPLKICDTAQ